MFLEADGIVVIVRPDSCSNLTFDIGPDGKHAFVLFASKKRHILLDELDSMESKGGDLLSALEREFVPTSGSLDSFESLESFDELPEGSTTTISEEEMEKALNEVKDDFEFAVKIDDEVLDEDK